MTPHGNENCADSAKHDFLPYRNSALIGTYSRINYWICHDLTIHSRRYRDLTRWKNCGEFFSNPAKVRSSILHFLRVKIDVPHSKSGIHSRCNLGLFCNAAANNFLWDFGGEKCHRVSFFGHEICPRTVWDNTFCCALKWELWKFSRRILWETEFSCLFCRIVQFFTVR